MQPFPEKPKRTLRRIHPMLYIILGGLAGAALMAALPGMITRLTAYFSPVTLPDSFTGSEFSAPAIDVAVAQNGLIALAVENANGTATIYLRELTAENDTIPMFKGNVRTLAENLPRFGELEFTADGKRLIVSPDGVPDNHVVRLMHVDDGNTWEFSGYYAAANQEHLYIASQNRLTHHDARTGEWLEQIALDDVTTIGGIALRGEDNVIASMVERTDGEALVLFTGMNAEPEDYLAEGVFRDIIFAPQGDRVIAAVDEKLLLHNIELAGATFGGMEDMGIINRLAVINDWLAVAGEKSIELYRYQTVPGFTTLLWRSERILTGHTGAVTGLAFLSDGKHLLTAGRDKQLILWNFVTGEQVWQMKI